MSAKLRTTTTTTGYYWPQHPGLVWHSGKFWLRDVEAKRVANNGSVAVLYAGRKLGLRKLRQSAQRCTVTLHDDLPF